MAIGLQVAPADPRPIWRQIEEGVLHLVATGALPASTAVPSVRELARELQVNPATVAKAYQRLVDGGVLQVRRGEGTFVASAPPALREREVAARLSSGAERYAALGWSLGVSRGAAADALRAAWNGQREEREK